MKNIHGLNITVGTKLALPHWKISRWVTVTGFFSPNSFFAINELNEEAIYYSNMQWIDCMTLFSTSDSSHFVSLPEELID